MSHNTLLRLTAFSIGAGLVVALGWFYSGWPSTLGEDWLWYRNGVDRLTDGLPLYRPEWLDGPFVYAAPENLYQYNQPPWLLPLIAPVAKLPPPLDAFTWFAVMAAAMAAAFALATNGRPDRNILLLLGVMVWPPTLMVVVWGNTEALVCAGVALWLSAHHRRASVLGGVGIVLASLKVVPAIPLVLLSLRDRQWKPVVIAAVTVAGLTVPSVIAGGPSVVADYIAITMNFALIDTHTNISPAAWADLPLGIVRIGAIVVILLGLIVRPVWLSLAVTQLASCGLATNVYISWLVPPVLPVLSRFTSPRAGLAAPMLDVRGLAGDELAAAQHMSR